MLLRLGKEQVVESRIFECHPNINLAILPITSPQFILSHAVVLTAVVRVLNMMILCRLKTLCRTEDSYAHIL